MQDYRVTQLHPRLTILFCLSFGSESHLQTPSTGTTRRQGYVTKALNANASMSEYRVSGNILDVEIYCVGKVVPFSGLKI
jgi:hypothetical protein